MKERTHNAVTAVVLGLLAATTGFSGYDALRVPPPSVVYTATLQASNTYYNITYNVTDVNVTFNTTYDVAYVTASYHFTLNATTYLNVTYLNVTFVNTTYDVNVTVTVNDSGCRGDSDSDSDHPRGWACDGDGGRGGWGQDAAGAPRPFILPRVER